MSALTLDQLRAQIASRLNRIDLNPDVYGAYIINDTINDRVDFYKSHCFYTGQIHDTSISTVAGTSKYAIPDGWEEFYTLSILQGGNWLELSRATNEFIERADSNSPSLPSLPLYWSVLGNEIWLGPGVPDAIYPVSILMNIPPGVPSMGSGSNFWTGDAKSLIINGVCAEIKETYLDDPQGGQRFRPLEEREKFRLQAKSFRHGGGIQVDSYL